MSLQFELFEEIGRTDQRGCQEFELCCLFDSELIYLALKSLFVLIGVVELVVVSVQILHVIRVAILLILKSQKLIILELFSVLAEYHHLLPILEGFADPFLVPADELILKTSGE